MQDNNMTTQGSQGDAEALRRGSFEHSDYAELADTSLGNTDNGLEQSELCAELADTVCENTDNDPKQSELPSLPTDAILIMGLTGSGKSTFISLLADEAVRVGHDLSSCTTETKGHLATYDEHCTLILDTPGFDDTDRSDFETMNEIAIGLHILHKKQLHLRGVVYVQRITDTRMSGASRRSLEILEAICGTPASPNIVFVTTMWDKLGSDSEVVGTERTEELKRLFLAKFIERGARVEPHTGTLESARGIINKMLCNQPMELDIQREMEDQKLTLEKTTVGQLLQRDLQRLQREYDAELEEIEQQLLEAKQSGDSTMTEMLTEDVAKLKEQVTQVQISSKRLGYDVQQLGEMKQAIEKQKLAEEQIPEIDIEQDAKNSIRDEIQGFKRDTILLQNEKECVKFNHDKQLASIQYSNDVRSGERWTAQKAKKRLSRLKQVEVTKVTVTFWEQSRREVFECEL